MTTIVFSQVQNNLFAAVNSRLFYIHKDTNNEIKNVQSHQEKKLVKTQLIETVGN